MRRKGVSFSVPSNVFLIDTKIKWNNEHTSIYTHLHPHSHVPMKYMKIIYSSIFPLTEVGIKIPDVYYFPDEGLRLP